MLAADADFSAATAPFSPVVADSIRAVLDLVVREVDLDLVRTAPADAAEPRGWSSTSVGSSFAIGVRSTGGEVVLRADDWDGETLDWWDFDLSAEPALAAKASPAPLTDPSGAPLTRLPSRLGFRGAPSVRYWEFEDGDVDLVRTTAAAHETALMAVLQFAFLYGGDWSSVPIEVAVGSRVTVASVVVRDAFGLRTLVLPVGSGSARPDVSETRLWTATGDATSSLLVFPRLAPVLEGDVVEETVLLRDEQANLAWAIELVAPDPAGYPVPWSVLAPPPPEPPSSSTELPSDRPPLRYRLATEVPRHWFPLVPEAAAGGLRLARYRVGVLPTGSTQPPRLPRALLLRELADAGLDEQEVPREGRRLVRKPVYARWSDGSTRVDGTSDRHGSRRRVERPRLRHARRVAQHQSSSVFGRRWRARHLVGRRIEPAHQVDPHPPSRLASVAADVGLFPAAARAGWAHRLGSVERGLERPGEPRDSCARVRHDALAVDTSRGRAAEEGENPGLLLRRRRSQSQLRAVIRRVLEPDVGVGLRERRVGRAGHGRVDPDAEPAEVERLARDVGADRLLALRVTRHVRVLLHPRHRVLVGRSGDELEERREVRLPPTSARGRHHRDGRAARHPSRFDDAAR